MWYRLWKRPRRGKESQNIVNFPSCKHVSARTVDGSFFFLSFCDVIHFTGTCESQQKMTSPENANRRRLNVTCLKYQFESLMNAGEVANEKTSQAS